jgi:hypothetical protein
LTTPIESAAYSRRASVLPVVAPGIVATAGFSCRVKRPLRFRDPT